MPRASSPSAPPSVSQTTSAGHGLCFSAACFLFGCAEAIWSFYEVVFENYTPSPSIADIGYLAYPTLFMIGVWHYNFRTRVAGVTFTQIGNLGIIVSSILLAYMFPYYGILRAAASPDLPPALMSVTYGVFDLVAFLFSLVVLTTHNELYRLVLSPSGDEVLLNETVFRGIGVGPLDVVALGDDAPFPGTIWVADHRADSIVIFEPDVEAAEAIASP